MLSAHLFLDDHDLLCWDVLEGEHKAPVEDALSIYGAVVHIFWVSSSLRSQLQGGRRKWTEPMAKSVNVLANPNKLLMSELLECHDYEHCIHNYR